MNNRKLFVFFLLEFLVPALCTQDSVFHVLRNKRSPDGPGGQGMKMEKGVGAGYGQHQEVEIAGQKFGAGYDVGGGVGGAPGGSNRRQKRDIMDMKMLMGSHETKILKDSVPYVLRNKRSPDGPSGEGMKMGQDGVGAGFGQHQEVEIAGQKFGVGYDVGGGVGGAPGDNNGRQKRDIMDMRHIEMLNNNGMGSHEKRNKRSPNGPGGQGNGQGIGAGYGQHAGVEIAGQKFGGGYDVGGGVGGNGAGAPGGGNRRQKRDLMNMAQDLAMNMGGQAMEMLNNGMGFHEARQREYNVFGQKLGMGYNAGVGTGDALEDMKQNFSGKRKRRSILERSKRSPCDKTPSTEPPAEAVAEENVSRKKRNVKLNSKTLGVIGFRKKRQAAGDDMNEANMEKAMEEQIGMVKKFTKALGDFWQNIKNAFQDMQKKFSNNQNEQGRDVETI